jgi:hypothetical protein
MKYPQAARVFEAAWDAFTPFLAFSPAVRKLLYTTNAIESLNYRLRKVTKARGHFPADDAVVKLLWLAIINIEDKRAPPPGHWQAIAPARPPRRRAACHGLARSPQRARHSLPQPPALGAHKSNNSKAFTHLGLQAPAEQRRCPRTDLRS